MAGRSPEAKATYNRQYYKSHTDYYSKYGKEYYEKNKEAVLLQKALRRYENGVKVGEHLIEKMRLKKMIT